MACEVSIGALWRFFHLRQITLKKIGARIRQERADVVIERWSDLMHHLNPRRLICFDESGAKTDIARGVWARVTG